MAYNFPVNYQPIYPQQFSQPPQQVQQSSIIWVQGEAGAKSYLVAPNNTVQLWDSENQVIYLKSADASGMPSMKILDYTIRESAQPVQPQVVATADYVTRDELKALEDRIREKMEHLTPKKKKEKDDESALHELWD